MAADLQRIFTVNLGNECLRIDEDLLTGAEVKKLKARIRETRAEYDKELEAAQTALNDLAKELTEAAKKLPDELDEKYAKRVKKVEADIERRAQEITDKLPKDQSYVMEIAYRCLKALADQFGQGNKVTRESFDLASYSGVKLKLAKLFIINEVPEADLFLPPKDLTETR